MGDLRALERFGVQGGSYKPIGARRKYGMKLDRRSGLAFSFGRSDRWAFYFWIPDRQSRQVLRSVAKIDGGN